MRCLENQKYYSQEQSKALNENYFTTPIAKYVWENKYRFVKHNEIQDHTLSDTWRRMARALSAVEGENHKIWEDKFYSILEDFRFLPGGRIHAGAGTDMRVTLLNCFVMGEIEDSMDSIFDNLKEAAITMQEGGGVGYDFSTLRPEGSAAQATGRIASGPVSFMNIWDVMCATVLSTGARRGAMLASLRCDHPDIEAFITAKRQKGVLTHFNLSVQVTDEFMQAVKQDKPWELVFPERTLDIAEAANKEVVSRVWTGGKEAEPCRVLKRVSARELWNKIMQSTYDHAEPGVLFVDRINQQNNLWYCEQITTTNPCGEIPLPSYGACDLGSINLTRFVREPFTDKAQLEFEAIENTAAIATRLMDNVLDVSRYPLGKQAEQARRARRTGIGITGLADAFIMLGIHYGEQPARDLAAKVMEAICHTAYRTSIKLAREKGSFSEFEKNKYLQSKFIQRLPDDIRDNINQYGIRNSHLLAIAPTGTISLLANNVSTGIEPVFDFRHTRAVLNRNGEYQRFEVLDNAFAQWQKLKGNTDELPDYFVNARQLPPRDHLAMQASLQASVDNAISKTINIPQDYPFDQFRSLYETAYELKLKGCTTFRPNPVTGEILSVEGISAEGLLSSHCCTIEREAD